MLTIFGNSEAKTSIQDMSDIYFCATFCLFAFQTSKISHFITAIFCRQRVDRSKNLKTKQQNSREIWKYFCFSIFDSDYQTHVIILAAGAILASMGVIPFCMPKQLKNTVVENLQFLSHKIQTFFEELLM